MIGIADIYIALREAVERACADAGIDAPVIAADLSEPIVRPSIKIVLSDDTAERDSTHLAARRMTARIYYFPPDAHRWRTAHYAMQDALRGALYDSLWVDSFEIPAGEGVEFDAVDGVLVGTIVYDWVEELPHADAGELMDNLTLHINT